MFTSRTSRRAFAAATIGAVAVFGITGFASTGAAAGPSRVLSDIFIPDAAPDHVVEQAPDGLSAGDTLLFDDVVLNPTTGRQIGSAVTRIQVVDELDGGDALFILDCTIRLPAGTIVFTGAEQFSHIASEVSFVVAGGTGRYASVDGSVTVTPTEVAGQPGGLLDFSLSR